jgi:hypothetical protein
MQALVIHGVICTLGYEYVVRKLQKRYHAHLNAKQQQSEAGLVKPSRCERGVNPIHSVDAKEVLPAPKAVDASLSKQPLLEDPTNARRSEASIRSPQLPSPSREVLPLPVKLDKDAAGQLQQANPQVGWRVPPYTSRKQAKGQATARVRTMCAFWMSVHSSLCVLKWKCMHI